MDKPTDFEPSYPPEVCEALSHYPRRPDDEGDRVEWVEVPGKRGEYIFTIDGRRFFNLFHDFPWALTDAERETFVKDQPYWADFFKSRLSGAS